MPDVFHYKQWDFVLYKNTAISERVKLQLRAEFFNILNHPNFSDPELPSLIADPATNLSSACGCGFVQAPTATAKSATADTKSLPPATSESAIRSSVAEVRAAFNWLSSSPSNS